MQIKKMPEAERPQEKLIYGGAGGLSNSELLALIIRTGTGDKSAVRLADEVISYANENTGGLGTAEVRELTEIDGIGEAKACSIVAAIELSKRLISDHHGAVKVRIRDLGNSHEQLVAVGYVLRRYAGGKSRQQDEQAEFSVFHVVGCRW